MATPTLSMLSWANGFVPEASGELVAFARDESQWAINKYVQYVPVPVPAGLFWQLGRDEFVRNEGGTVAPTALGGGGGSALKAWEPGDEIPYGHGQKVPFVLQEYHCNYRTEPWICSHDEIDLAQVFSPKLVYTRAAVTKMLTDRTNRIAGILTNTANFGTHTNSANAINGGRGPWSTGSDDPSSPSYLAIYRTLVAMYRQIHLDTNGVVRRDDLHTVVSPDLAIAMAGSPEMVNYCRESSVSQKLLEEGYDPQYQRWGLPERYKGFHFVVEDAPIVTANVTLGAAGGGLPNQPIQAAESSSRQFIWPSSIATMVSRVGKLDGEFGSKSYSSFQVFHYGGLLQQYAFDQPHNFRVIGVVRECPDFRIVASMSAYCVTGCL
jgi:hypothetical protein